MYASKPFSYTLIEYSIYLPSSQKMNLLFLLPCVAKTFQSKVEEYKSLGFLIPLNKSEDIFFEIAHDCSKLNVSSLFNIRISNLI